MHLEIDARMSMIFIKQLRAILCSELLSEAQINTSAISGISTMTAFLFLEQRKKYINLDMEKDKPVYYVPLARQLLAGKKKAVMLIATLSHPLLEILSVYFIKSEKDSHLKSKVSSTSYNKHTKNKQSKTICLTNTRS